MPRLGGACAVPGERPRVRPRQWRLTPRPVSDRRSLLRQARCRFQGTDANVRALHRRSGGHRLTTGCGSLRLCYPSLVRGPPGPRHLPHGFPPVGFFMCHAAPAFRARRTFADRYASFAKCAPLSRGFSTPQTLLWATGSRGDLMLEARQEGRTRCLRHRLGVVGDERSGRQRGPRGQSRDRRGQISRTVPFYRNAVNRSPCVARRSGVIRLFTLSQC